MNGRGAYLRSVLVLRDTSCRYSNAGISWDHKMVAGVRFKQSSKT